MIQAVGDGQDVAVAVVGVLRGVAVGVGDGGLFVQGVVDVGGCVVVASVAVSRLPSGSYVGVGRGRCVAAAAPADGGEHLDVDPPQRIVLEEVVWPFGSVTDMSSSSRSYP